MADLFDQPAPKRKSRKSGYSADDIEVLEGLDPVRMRPGMYIGGTDEGAMHHLVAEVLDNSMDEAIAGHATWIDVELAPDGAVTVRDNGRGIPTDPHPKFKNKSALEVVMTTLHSGGKFSGEVYKTSGGLHGVGLSVVNALSDVLTVEVSRDKTQWTQSYKRGKPVGKLTEKAGVRNRRGTAVTFHPDPLIFGDKAAFRAARLYRLARSKAYLYKGVEIRWKCAAEKLRDAKDTPEKATLHFPGGLRDFLAESLEDRTTVTPKPFAGAGELNGGGGRVEWAVTWPEHGDGFMSSYCNTVPTAQGGTHETGLRSALSRGLKAYGEMTGNKRAAQIVADDVMISACGLLSVFITDPQFQGQTKEKLSTPGVSRLVEGSIKDHFDHFLSGDPETANALLDSVLERAEERLQRRQAREVSRKSATRKLRLPGKLTDCTLSGADGTEIFLVEGDSAGGSAKQARNRKNQAILPLRGKILNVASASAEKLRGNQELADLVQALGPGTGAGYDDAKLRYERVIIMTDADVDGAHIASLLMTFFYREMPELIENGHLFLAMPPLYRLSQGGDTAYAKDEAHRDELIKNHFTGRGKIDISRFKGLGEMPPGQLKETTMDPGTRTLLRVRIPPETEEARGRKAKIKAGSTADLVERLMGRKPESRMEFIQKNAGRVENLDI
jgi:topoisomerase-4 subunit B